MGRFAKTVLFFNPPPSPLAALLAPLRAVGLLPKQPPADATPFTRLDGSAAPPRRARDAVLVAGATGGVGARVVQLLLREGVPVRALVRDARKAATLFAAADVAHPGLLELALADVAQPATLPAGLAAGVRAVVWATSATVAPKEGDTAARDKYRQGIKFYDPQVVGDTPEAVDANGVRALLAAVAPALRTAPEHASPSANADAEDDDVAVVFDAALPGGGGPAWGALDDVVMGGVSFSSLQLAPGAGEAGRPAGVFAGTLSTANSGGFASVRTRNWAPAPLDASGAQGVALRLRGDGQRYKLFLRTEAGWDALAYGASFDTPPNGAWATVRVPLAAFKPIFRAKTVLGAPPLDPGRICSAQLMLSKFEYDGELNPKFAGDGEFSLPIERITFYGSSRKAAASSGGDAATWVHVSSAGVTRPDRPGIDVSVEPPAVRMNAELGGLLTHKLAGEDAVRAARLRHVIVRPVALTEEPRGAELQVSQGDVIKGKISRDDVAECVVAAVQGRAGPAVLGSTFELKSTVPFSQPWTAEDAAKAPPSRDWRALLADVRPGVTGKTVNGVYTGTAPEAEALAAVGR